MQNSSCDFNSSAFRRPQPARQQPALLLLLDLLLAGCVVGAALLSGGVPGRRVAYPARLDVCGQTLAVMHEGDEITTIEGLGTPAQLHPMQSAFVRHDGFQCGYCTPGQICSAIAVLEEIRAGIPSHVSPSLTAAPSLTAEELRERMSGNICRCGAYSNIAEAILEVAGAAA